MFRKQHRNCYITTVLVLLLNIDTSFAVQKNASAPTQKPTLLRDLQPVLTLTSGASIAQSGSSQSFQPLDLCHYNYTPKNTSTNLLLGAFIGSEVKQTPSWKLITGAGYYQPLSFGIKGTLIQGADAASNSFYHYQYKIRSQQLLAESKLYWLLKEKYQPFLMVGIGASFNKTSNYQTNIPPFLEFTPTFSNRLQTTFTYAIGPGVDVSLSRSFRIGAAYRFTDLGSANTGHAEMDTIPIASRLKQSHLYANQILIQLTYVPWRE